MAANAYKICDHTVTLEHGKFQSISHFIYQSMHISKDLLNLRNRND